jgi:hypothetical protein
MYNCTCTQMHAAKAPGALVGAHTGASYSAARAAGRFRILNVHKRQVLGKNLSLLQ